MIWEAGTTLPLVEKSVTQERVDDYGGRFRRLQPDTP